MTVHRKKSKDKPEAQSSVSTPAGRDPAFLAGVPRPAGMESMTPEQVAQLEAEVVSGPLLGNAFALGVFSHHISTPGVSDCIEAKTSAAVIALTAVTDRVKGGNLSDLKALLTTQAFTLNRMFESAAIRGQESQEGPLEGHAWMRLALDAQAACRATVATLGQVAGNRGTSPDGGRRD